MNKKVILLVDNRSIQEEQYEPDNNIFKGSGFKATEVDPQDQSDLLYDSSMDYSLLEELRQKIICLESRVSQLERGSSLNRPKRRLRRKASELHREFRCPDKNCGKLYGSDTSLKNHLKIKHRNTK